MRTKNQCLPGKAASSTHELIVTTTAYRSRLQAQVRRNISMAIGDGHEVPLLSKNLLQLIVVERKTVFFKRVATDGFHTFHIHERVGTKTGLDG